MKKFLALAVLTSIVAAPAMAETFTHEGVTYNYRVKEIGTRTLIAGTNVTTGESFRLRVNGGKVTGRMGFRPISFSVDSAKLASLEAGKLAAN